MVYNNLFKHQNHNKNMKRRGILENKKGAFELSVSTMIIIVLAIIILIMGLTFLRKIFGGATDSIDTINEQMTKEINKLFTDEKQTIVVYLADKTASVRAGTTNFNFWIAAKTKYGNDVTSREDIQYSLTLDKTSSCYKQNPTMVEKWFTDKLSSTEMNYNPVREYQGDTGYARIQISLPEGTRLCTQTVLVDFIDNSNADQQELPIGGTSFTIEVLRQALF